VQNVQQPEHSTFDGLNGFIRDIGLSIYESKSEFILLSRTHTNPLVCVRLNGQCMSVVTKFQYLGVVFN
jgi:hypothetical protein